MTLNKFKCQRNRSQKGLSTGEAHRGHEAARYSVAMRKVGREMENIQLPGLSTSISDGGLMI
jgi:hypothetical protein